MSDAKEIEKITVLAAGSRLFSLLPQFAGIIAGLTALAYFVGWRELFSYYDALGAPWAVSLLPSAVIMQTSFNMISALALSCFFSFYMYSNGLVGLKGLSRLILFSVVIAIPAVLASSFGDKWISTNMTHTFAKVVAILWAVHAGISLTVLIANLAEKGLKWETQHLYLAYIVFFIGCWAAPESLGTARSKVDLDQDASTLPTVFTADFPNGPRWQLVSAIDGHVLLMQQATESWPRRFRLAKNEDVKFVHFVPSRRQFAKGY